MDKLMTFFIDTLNLILLPNKEYSASYMSSIQSKLDDLEGDYYTFLHEKNVQALVEAGCIKPEAVGEVRHIRAKIDSLANTLWNPLDFIHNADWIEIRNLVLSLFENETLDQMHNNSSK